LAGVLSGIAYYFNIDPLMDAVAYTCCLFFGVSILPSIAGFLFIGYIVMWIVVPASDELKEEKKDQEDVSRSRRQGAGRCSERHCGLFWCGRGDHSVAVLRFHISSLARA
jgi:phage shock protein PspC (stress-responsive transcriptional regulator)